MREEGGAPEKYEFEDGCYVIVMTPTTKQNAVYNSFLAFAVEGSGSNVDSFDSIDSYDELKKIRDELAMPGDPVDLLTGSFTWNYTDFALYGENDLKFTRYYESVKADKNYGLGNGWTSNFTYSLEFGDLYAQVTLPQGTELFFDLDFDGSYANCGDYSLEWAGGSYVMKDKAGNQYRFTPDGQIQYIAYVNGDVASFSCKYYHSRTSLQKFTCRYYKTINYIPTLFPQTARPAQAAQRISLRCLNRNIA